MSESEPFPVLDEGKATLGIFAIEGALWACEGAWRRAPVGLSG